MSDHKVTEIPDDSVIIGMDDYEAIAEGRQQVSEVPDHKNVGDTMTFVAMASPAEDDDQPYFMPPVVRRITAIQKTATLGAVKPLPVLYYNQDQYDAIVDAMRVFAAGITRSESQAVVRDILDDIT